MPRSRRSVVMSIALLCLLVGGRAEAVQRSFVASTGSDSNTSFNCDLVHPCRSFTAAVSVTSPNGEVIVLDSAAYGVVTIDKSISLTAPAGVYGGITVFAGTGVTIATAGVNVVLRGLTINGQGGSGGIGMTAGARLSVENCVIANLTGSAIDVNTAAVVRIADTTVRDNGNGVYLQNGARATITRSSISGSAGNGILVYGTVAGTTTADVADTTVDGNGTGLYAYSQSASSLVKVSVRDSRIVRNVPNGMLAESVGGAAVTLSVSNNVVSNNGAGVGSVGAGSKVWASGNTVSDNVNTGFANSVSSLFESAGNNAIRNNGVDTSGTIGGIGTQ